MSVIAPTVSQPAAQCDNIHDMRLIVNRALKELFSISPPHFSIVVNNKSKVIYQSLFLSFFDTLVCAYTCLLPDLPKCDDNLIKYLKLWRRVNSRILFTQLFVSCILTTTELSWCAFSIGCWQCFAYIMRYSMTILYFYLWSRVVNPFHLVIFNKKERRGEDK